jgi:LuxR family maltose regulon positive regulatory protein
LIERLNEGLHRKLTLIAAPAGFGKTTLVSAWIAGWEQRESLIRAAWLSLDEGDNDLARFLTYLVTALQTIEPGVGTGLLSVLQSPQPPATEAVLTALLNEITTHPDPFVLVLDDYHVIDTQTVDDALTFLIEHMPPQMHLAITTREDPQLPLARLRARGELCELRASDLRFIPFEAAAFLNEAMGLDLSEESVTALEIRTEGWIAGLQLAAISIQGHQDIPAFIRAFAGDHRYIVDYLVEEVLQRQPESTRRFLLQTSILDRLNGPLCDAVTGQEGGSARLEALERGNFFVVPLDDRRHWYRYHHLFAEVLYTRLIAETTGTTEQAYEVSILHKRASEWYEHNDLIAYAIRHALAAEDFDRAADLIERALPATFRSRQEATVFGWLKALPDELIHFRPVLSSGYAHALLSHGELEGVEARLRNAERWLDNMDTTVDRSEMVVVDEEEFRRLPGSIAVARAGQAMALGDVLGTAHYAQRVLDLAPEDDHLSRGGAACFLGLLSWATGDLEAAYLTYAGGMAHLQKAGNISDVIGCAVTLADIQIAQGRNREAMRTYERGLQLATQTATAHGDPVMRGTADMYVGLSALYRERGDLSAATQQLLRSKALGEHIGFPRNPYRWCVAMARIRESHGDLDGALELLQEAERRYVSDFSPNVHPVPALKVRVWIAQGRLDEALGWVRERGLSVEEDLSYLREFEHITLARLLLAQYSSARGDRTERSSLDELGLMELLERLLQAAEDGKRTGSVIEILVLQALAQSAQGDIPAALMPLQRALALAESEGYIRIFVEQGLPLAVLLEEAAKHGIARSYVRQLLAAFGEARAAGEAGEAGEAEDKTPAKQLLIEPLSERELEVLRLLRTELNGPEIAGELMVSLNTMRTHTNNIYNKLGVNNRRAAVRQAEEIGLL